MGDPTPSMKEFGEMQDENKALKERVGELEWEKTCLELERTCLEGEKQCLEEQKQGLERELAEAQEILKRL